MSATSDLVIMPPAGIVGRRGLMRGAGKATLSAAAIAILAGCKASNMASAQDAAADVDTLNVALGLEHEAINAYQLGAESGLLSQGVLPVAVLFQGHHKGHRDALVKTITTLGGTPVAELSLDEYATALNAGSLKSEADVLELAARLELGAVNAYLGVLPSFEDKTLGQVSARLAADETMHWSILTHALGKPLPADPLSFGA
jgi:rubrerythrin